MIQAPKGKGVEIGGGVRPRIGVRFPAGRATGDLAWLADRLQAIESAGCSSIWVSDHIALPSRTKSRYPFSESGSPSWRPYGPWPECLTISGILLALTSQMSVGSSVIVLPQRNALLVAKTVGTLSAVSGGRFTLGVGAGWLTEEIELMGGRFRERGRMLEEQIAVMRDLWGGRTEGVTGELCSVPSGLYCIPRPLEGSAAPVYVGGHSRLALERAARLGDGWIGFLRADQSAAEIVGPAVELLRSEALRLERKTPKVVVCLSGQSVPLRRRTDIINALTAIGVDEIAVDMSWESPDLLVKEIEELSSVG